MAVDPYSPTYSEGYRHEAWPVQEVQPAVYLPMPEAAQRVYERGSIAETLQRMFKEADQMPGAYMDQEEGYAFDMHPDHAKAYQEIMFEIQNLVLDSPSVKHLRNIVEHNNQATNPGDKKEITVADVEAVFRAYENALRQAIAKKRSVMTTKQMNVLKFQTRSELDYGFRDVITRHLILSGEHEMKFDPLDFFLLANPHARKIDYMSNPEILETLKHSMTIKSMRTDRLRNDVRVIEAQSHRPDFQELMESDVVHQVKLEIRPKST